MKEKALLLSLLLFTATGQVAAREPAKQQAARAQLAYQAGNYAESARIYGEVADSLTDTAGVFEQELLYSGAAAAARAGNRDQALDFLERAVKAGVMQADRIRHDPSLASLQSDPRLETLLTRYRHGESTQRQDLEQSEFHFGLQRDPQRRPACRRPLPSLVRSEVQFRQLRPGAGPRLGRVVSRDLAAGARSA